MTISSASIHDNSKAVGSASFAGIEALKGSITISRSKIASNRGGGITVDSNGQFAVIGNTFLGNGDVTANTGGISLTIPTPNPGNRLEFNTFAENKSTTGTTAGIQCMVGGSGFTAQNNIVWNNNGPTSVQVGGSCQHAYSDIGPIPITGGLDGGRNLSSDPMFKDPTIDFHVKPGSQVQGKANPAADLTGLASKDIDGHPRVPPADLGAYVVPAQ